MEELTLSRNIAGEELDPKEKRKFWEDHIQTWHESGLPSQVLFKSDLYEYGHCEGSGWSHR